MPLLLGLGLLLSAAARAQHDDPPGRVGRLAHTEGAVSWFDHEDGRWGEADRNRPLTSGDRLATGPAGRAELRVGSTVLRLAPATELEVLRLDDERMAWQLHSGSVAVRLRTREAAQETELVTGEVRLQPERAGHYRIDRTDDTSWAGAWRGSLRVAEPGASGAPVVIETGQRVELWRESARWAAGSGASAALRQRPGRWVEDGFSAWVLAEERQDERTTAYRYVSPEMTGAEELDRHGRWEQHPEYGPMWLPTQVAADWAPYRHGRWAWVQPWGWTWVDEARWGFAPFHYGRWVNWRGRWAWCPGSYVARPVFAPALVAWVGGPRLGVSLSVGFPAVAWVPLAPREPYMPHYRHSPVYVGRINGPLPPHTHTPGPWPHRHPAPIGQQPAQQASPVAYGNQGVPGGVTVVARDVLLQRQPVARAVVDVQQPAQRLEWRAPGAGWEPVAPPTLERRQRPGHDRDQHRGHAPFTVGRPDVPEAPRGRFEPPSAQPPVSITTPAPRWGSGVEPAQPARGPGVQVPVQAPPQPPVQAPAQPPVQSSMQAPVQSPGQTNPQAPVAASGQSSGHVSGQMPVQGPALVDNRPPVRQPPQPPLQTTPPLQPAAPTPPAAAPGPAMPRYQVPATEPRTPGSDTRPRGENHPREHRNGDRPEWSDSPARPSAAASPVGIATPGPASPAAPARPVQAPAAPPAAAAAPVAPAAPMATTPAPRPAPAPAPAPRAERPRDGDKTEKPAQPGRTDAEEGRKRGPDNRPRPREMMN